MNPEYVALLEDLLGRARRGEDRGVVALVDQATGKPRVVTRGSLADDNERVAKLVARALSAFCQRAYIARPAVAVRRFIPRHLKA